MNEFWTGTPGAGSGDPLSLDDPGILVGSYPGRINE
jgi:hypothetical protein